MDFISKFYDAFKNFKTFTQTNSTNPYGYFWSEEYVLFENHFTEAERQQLKALLSKEISNLEAYKRINKDGAKGMKRIGEKELANIYYKEAGRIQKKINSIAKLQHKVKYKLETRG